MLNIFVLALDQENREVLEELDHPDHQFLGLLEPDRLVGAGAEDLDLPALISQAEEQLSAAPGAVDAIIGFWDFPVSCMVPMMCGPRGLPSAPLEAVAKCEHKYWSRIEQQKVIDELPNFGLVPLERAGEHDELPAGLDFPVWLKPVKSASSDLAFHVADQGQLDACMEEIRAGVDRLGEPFQHVLDQLDLPEEIERVGGSAALAEESVSGAQLTVEGFEDAGRLHIYGIIDADTYADSPSFRRYVYPSQLPAGVQDRLVDSTTKVIRQLGLTNSTFNIEYFWDSATDRLALLEVNPRHSQQHAWLFEQVDGVANHEVVVQLGLGQSPELISRRGPWAVAARYFLRHFTDGVVTRCPTTADVERIEATIPGVTVELVAEEGQRLEDLSQQDSYSFELALVHVGARDIDDLEEKYRQCREGLVFEIDEAPARTES